MAPANDFLNDFPQAQIDRILSTIDIPVCPAIVTEVMKEAQKDLPDMRKLAKGIAADVGMSAIALKLVNSVLFRSSSPIHDVSKAVARLGARNVLCVVVAAALQNSLKGGNSRFLEQFWSRISATAEAAVLVAKRQFGIPPDIVYTYALFHDAAIPVMARKFVEYPALLEEYGEDSILLVEMEKARLPCTHPVVGALLVKNWGLPQVLHQGIRFHHEPDLYDLPESVLPGEAVTLIAVTQVAEYLIGQSGDEDKNGMVAKACCHLGLADEDLAELEEAVAMPA